MTTYISAVPAPGAKITTKAALKAAIKADPNSVEFVSTDSQHRRGSWFTVGEAVTTYGPSVGIQVRLPRGIAMIEATASKAVVL